MKNKNHGRSSLVLFLAFVLSFPLLLTNCSGGGGDGAPAAAEEPTPERTRFLYVATLSDDANSLIKIDTATNTQVAIHEIGFTPTFPANQLNEGTIFWGTQGANLFGYDVAAGSSVLRTAWETNPILRVFARAYEFVTPEKAMARSGGVSCAIGSGANNPLARDPQATGVAHGGGGSWTALTKDGQNVWVASWESAAGEGASGIHQMFNTSGELQYTINPVTGQTTDASGAVMFDFDSQYVADGGTMPGGNAGLGAGDLFTTASPCDVSIIEMNATEYGWGVDVNGDTITGFNASTGEIVGQMIFMPVGPDQKANGFIAPFMNSTGITANGTAINTTENLRGARSESIVDVSDPASPREIVRIFENFQDADGAGWDFSSGGLENYTDVSSMYAMKLDGAVSTKVYEWANPMEGYPRFITDGLTPGTTSEIHPGGLFAYVWGAPISVIDLTGDAPWVVSHAIELTTGGGGVGTFNVDGSKAYVGTSADGAGQLPVIDTATHTVTDLIPITGQARGMAMMFDQ